VNDVEARLVGLAITEPEYAIPRARAVGLVWSDFLGKAHRELWEGLVEMWDIGMGIDPATVKARLHKDTYVDQLAEVTGTIDADSYARIIVERAIKRGQLALVNRIQSLTKDHDTREVLAEAQSELDRLSARYARMVNPIAVNPADELATSRAWSTTTGLLFLDRLVRLTSGSIHFLAGDPGSGKSTLVSHMLAHNAKRGVNSVGILAESSPLDIKMAMLTQTQHITARFASLVRYNPNFRTRDNIQTVRELWDDHYTDLPLSIYRVNEGPDAVVSLVSSITVPSLICIDHAYAVVSQGRVRADGKEHQTFMRLFAAVETAAKRNNHVIVMANQYTKAGRSEETRGPDAQYGGSGVQNIASTMIHLYQPMAEIDTAVGYRKMRFTIPKCRALLVVDENNRDVDPVQVTREYPGMFWLNTRYRLAQAEMPVARG
jgi:hypothetical protein